MKATMTNVSEGASNSYQIHSTALVQLTEKDIGSKLTCKIQHPSLSKPLEQRFDLNKVLRVAPKVTLTTSHTSPIPLNRSVMLTCKADNFYPRNISVSWWRSDYSNYTKNSSHSKENKNKTFHLHLPLPAQQASKMETTYMCRVIHDSEKIYYASLTLKFGMPPEGSAGYFLLFCLWTGLFLGKIVAAVLLLYLFWKISISKINTRTLTKRDSSK
uniref:Uncharacterized protein n=1 Tax=Sphaerodactylus townsendi TaxID=933632 RepID=A0ACB8F790_9SAUR